MQLTKKLLTSVCPVAILAAPLVLGITPAFAQSTGTQEVETVVVTGTRLSTNGLMNAAPISKERSTITSEFLNTQIAGQTVFQALNFMPGVNFTNNDPYGSSGGNIRMHGQDGNHISLTLDGMPLNDTGNYAIYTNQMVDAEVVDRISANQGSTDVDSPTAAATGGVVAIVTDKPHDDFGAEAVLTGGSYSDQRYFGRVDTGKFGPWGTQAFAALSWQDYDKYKGPGELRKIQGNIKFLQDLGSVGWITLAGHWNTNRNNSYYGEYYAPNTTGYTSSLAAQADIVKNPSGGGYIANPLNTSTRLRTH
ncbi:MAG: TonB-dependent receptor plug domain-containing protein [Alphaproteobacteria bacterium]|nr:TonB-dependent receptor plug domain-containing protein [Alphaproteobacteria bacterium]